jgi:hypothetical protein
MQRSEQTQELVEMAEYQVILKDTEGYKIASDAIEGIKAAKTRAKYLLTDEYAQRIGTDHKTLGTHKVEVHNKSVVVWDAFRTGGLSREALPCAKSNCGLE